MFGRTPKPPVSIDLPEEISADTAQAICGDLFPEDARHSKRSITVNASDVGHAEYRLNEIVELRKKGTR